MSNHLEFVPPFISPLTHDQHARLGRIAVLWGQIDMILDYMLDVALDLKPRQRMTLIGEKPIGAKLDMLSNHFDDIKDQKARELARQFWDLAHQTKTIRNRCFHGVWGFRVGKPHKVTAAATHFKSGADPVRSTQLPALEKKLCRTARVGMDALILLHEFNRKSGCNRLYHGPGDPPEWLEEWREQHPLDDRSLDRRWKLGQLPFATNPL